MLWKLCCKEEEPSGTKKGWWLDYHKRKQVKNTPTDNVSVADIIANLDEDSESDDDEAPDHDIENCEVLF